MHGDAFLRELRENFGVSGLYTAGARDGKAGVRVRDKRECQAGDRAGNTKWEGDCD